LRETLVTTSQFSTNFVAAYGGALLYDATNVTVINSVFRSNTAGTGGAVIQASRSANAYSYWFNSTFDSNIAYKIFSHGKLIFPRRDAHSGGISVSLLGNSSLVMDHMLFTNNYAAWYGGVTHIEGNNYTIFLILGGNVTFTNCVAIGNYVNTSSFSPVGAAISLNSPIQSLVANSRFYNNTALYGIVAYYQSNTTQYITNCTFDTNYADGAIYSLKAPFAVENCSIINTRAPDIGRGIGVYMLNVYNASITDSLITGNWLYAVFLMKREYNAWNRM
jgi:hypothetical protein